jgi:hypothetical protein
MMGLRAKRELHWQEIGGGSVGTFPIASIMKTPHPGVNFFNAKNSNKTSFFDQPAGRRLNTVPQK